MEIAAKIFWAPSTVHDRFQEWQRAGFFESMWIAGLLEYNRERGLKRLEKKLNNGNDLPA
jgi:hypothetical protein